MIHTAYNLYEEYKRAWYQAADAVEALKANFADEATIIKAEKARDLYQCLANMWGRLFRYNLPDDQEIMRDKIDSEAFDGYGGDEEYPNQGLSEFPGGF